MATSAVAEIKQVLADFNQVNGALLSAVISRAGVPMAWNMPSDIHSENFSTLTATLLGASEVLYTGLKRRSPERVVVESPEGTLITVGLGPKAFLVALAPEATGAFLEATDSVVASLKEILKTA